MQKDVGEFERLLDGRGNEQELHEFLAYHSYSFNGIIRLDGASPLYSKIKLGGDFEGDFACFDAGTSGQEWHLIAIEGLGFPLFTKKGDPSRQLTHAIREVGDSKQRLTHGDDLAGIRRALGEDPVDGRGHHNGGRCLACALQHLSARDGIRCPPWSTAER